MRMGSAARNGRRGIASIVATVILFAILFTVGTSYFIFVNSENASYVQSLLGATNKVQGSINEGLSVTTLLEADGDVGFYVNNTSSTTVNMTAVLVISSTGALLKCDGVGFPAGAGCSNTTPTLWTVVNSGAGSAEIDTNYVYATGTTDTVKVLTARGNTYTQTYPEPASQSGSSQSVTVNLDNLKWVQLIPQASSLVQKNYVANCNAASCALAYSSSVTAANILVDGISWSNQAPPSTPTDTRGDLFTLGASSSVAVPSSPALVQDKYTSNCDAVSCGLAFNSNVVLGHTLVYAVGWENHAAPSAPTDTRGNLFTLGSSQSVTVNPPTPALVQHRYLTNCNSATCALAYSSSVTAGNTLVLGLGWPTTQVYGYIPITITNSQSSATTNPFQQIVTWNPSTYSSYEATNLGNIRFCTTATCGTALNAWLESCSSTCSTSGSSSTSASAWVQLTSSIAGSGGQLTIYMVFESTSTTFDGVHWGEAPQLSPTYAQYDNGASVFTAYFNGNTATSSFSVYSGYTLSQATVVSGPGGTTINAIEITGYNGANAVFSFNTAMSNVGLIAESSFSSPGCTSTNPYTGTDTGVAGLMNNAVAASVNNGISDNCGYGGGYFNQDYESGGTVTTDQNGAGTATSSWLYATLTYTSSGASSYSAYISPQFYSTTGGSSGTVSSNPLSAATHLYLGQISSTTSSNIIAIYYNFDRARAYPPSGVMPSTSFGSTTPGTGSPLSVTDTLGDTFTVGVSQSVASGATTYVSSMWYATAASSGSDTITATFSAAVAGSVSIYELAGYSTVGVLSSSGSSPGSTSASVGSFTPNSNSFAVGNVETGSATTKYTVGTGYTTVASGGGGCDASDASQGCSEYEAGLGSATTAPFTLSASTPWVDVAASFTPLTSNTYYSYIYYVAYGGTSGADTISANFGTTVAGSVSIYEISGVTATGLLSQTGSSTTSQGATSVTSMTPNAGSFVVGNAETTPTTYTAGSGYTLSGGCGSVSGCGEYQAGVGSATTVPMTVSPSTPWVEAAVAFAPVITTYYSYIWYATAASSGADTITATFGAAVVASVSIYEITGYTVTGVLSSTGSSVSGSTTAAVTPFTPASDSFIVGNANGAATTTYTATSGFTLVGTCTTVPGGCSEYSAGGGGTANTVPMTLGVSTPWAEAALSFSTPFNPQSGIQVNGYPTMGVPSGASLVWEVTFTNVDPLHRAITIWPQTEMAIGSAEYDGFDTDYTQAHYYLITSLNPGSTTVNAYSTSGFITLAYNVPTTLYFASTTALGSATQAFGTNVLTPFEAYFALTGIFSDGTLYGETIPYPYGIITQANAYTTPTVGATGNTVTVSCTSPCDFGDNTKAVVGWINAIGQLTQLTTFTTTATGNVPAGVTFSVPTATAGYYTIEVTDYTNSVFMTFQHT
jgi:hypothetical protein